MISSQIYIQSSNKITNLKMSKKDIIDAIT